MLMRMLITAGLPRTGGAISPLWEDGRVIRLPRDHRWLDECHGGVLKLLTPHRMTPPVGGEYRWLWLDRDPVEQKKSQHKTAAWMKRKRMPFKLKKWRAASLETIARVGGPLLMLQYEYILADPIRYAEIIGVFCGGLDPAIMAAQVRDRGPECLPHMAEGVFIPTSFDPRGKVRHDR
jgi:hypothetical protein